jgi:hypothetical protein
MQMPSLQYSFSDCGGILGMSPKCLACLIKFYQTLSGDMALVQSVCYAWEASWSILLHCGSYKYLEYAFMNLLSSAFHSQDIPHHQPQLKSCFSGLPSSSRPWPWSRLLQHRPLAHSPARQYSQLSGSSSIPQMPPCPTLRIGCFRMEVPHRAPWPSNSLTRAVHLTRAVRSPNLSLQNQTNFHSLCFFSSTHLRRLRNPPHCLRLPGLHHRPSLHHHRKPNPTATDQRHLPPPKRFY